MVTEIKVSVRTPRDVTVTLDETGEYPVLTVTAPDPRKLPKPCGATEARARAWDWYARMRAAINKPGARLTDEAIAAAASLDCLHRGIRSDYAHALLNRYADRPVNAEHLAGALDNIALHNGYSRQWTAPAQQPATE